MFVAEKLRLGEFVACLAIEFFSLSVAIIKISALESYAERHESSMKNRLNFFWETVAASKESCSIFWILLSESSIRDSSSTGSFCRRPGRRKAWNRRNSKETWSMIPSFSSRGSLPQQVSIRQNPTCLGARFMLPRIAPDQAQHRDPSISLRRPCGRQSKLSASSSLQIWTANKRFHSICKLHRLDHFLKFTTHSDLEILCSNRSDY